MPAYSSSPFAQPILMTPGKPEYVYGGFNDRVGDSKMLVTNVALTTNVATLSVKVIEGNIPATGSFISVQGTASTAGLFNVTNVALTGVTIDATTGVGTLTFALTHANVGSAADAGVAIAKVPETSETLANGSSIALVAPSLVTALNQGKSLKAVVSFPTLPTGVTVALQEAVYNQESEFSTISTVASVSASVMSGGQFTVTVTPGRYYRLNTSGLSGSGTIIGKLLC